jgi:hypothetical protein
VGRKTSTSPGAKNCSYNGSKSLQRSHSEVCIRLRDTESDAESDIDGRSLYPASPLVRWCCVSVCVCKERKIIRGRARVGWEVVCV